MIPTWARPATIVFSPAPCPCTSAEGLSTLRYSAGKLNCLPSSNAISSRLAARFNRNSTGQGAADFTTSRSPFSDRRQPLPGELVVAQGARLIHQHDRDAVADRVG